MLEGSPVPVSFVAGGVQAGALALEESEKFISAKVHNLLVLRVEIPERLQERAEVRERVRRLRIDVAASGQQRANETSE